MISTASTPLQIPKLLADPLPHLAQTPAPASNDHLARARRPGKAHLGSRRGMNLMRRRRHLEPFLACDCAEDEERWTQLCEKDERVICFRCGRVSLSKRWKGDRDLRPEMGVLELLTTTSMTSETGNARRLGRGEEPGLASDAVLLGESEKNLETDRSSAWAVPSAFEAVLTSTRPRPRLRGD